MVTFNHIELNKETNCLEAYLKGETDARTDIPFDTECIASLIDLLQKYYQEQPAKLLLSQELEQFLFRGELALHKQAVIEELYKLSQQAVQLVLLEADERKDQIYLSTLLCNEEEKKLEYMDNAILLNYTNALYSEFKANYIKQMPSSNLRLVVNIEFTDSVIKNYLLSVEEKQDNNITQIR